MWEALSLFHELEDAHRDWLLDHAEERQVISRTTLIQEGTVPESLYVVLQGLVEVQAPHGAAESLALLGPGELLGEISLLEESVATATVATLENSLLLAIPRQRLLEQLDANAAFAADWYRAVGLTLSRRLRERVATLTERLRAKDESDESVAAAWRPTLELIRHFKQLILELDRQALKNGGVSDELRDMTSRQFQEFVKTLNDQMGDASGLDEATQRELGRRLAVELHPYVLLTTTTERFLSKPRGYAGDFFTIEMIYRNQPGGSQRLGSVIDSWFLDSSAAGAVRNRRGLLAREIRHTCEAAGAGPARICTLACGPAAEVFDVLETPDLGPRIDATLIDIDQQAIAFVMAKAAEKNLLKQVRLVEGNLVYLAAGRQQIQNLAPQDLVYSIGLIDYFNDKWVVKLLDYIHSLLAPGGRVILGNFHPRNPNKVFMDHVLDWKLIHRSEADMDRLFAQSKFGRRSTNLWFEDEGVNLFAECVKAPADSPRVADPALRARFAEQASLVM